MHPTPSLDTSPVQLTDEQRASFERDGFLVLRNVLSPAEIEFYLEVVDRLAAADRAQRGVDDAAGVEIRNAIALAPEMLPLLTHPKAFPLMAQIMGWNIQLTTSHVFVRPTTPSAGASHKAIDWHADGPNPGFPAINGVSPRMYAKIGFFMTDLSEPNRGNLRVVPGSHLSAAKPPMDENGEPIGAIQVCTHPGDAVLFEQRTWHAVGPNYAPHARKNIYIGYCHRWLKAIDFLSQPAELIEQANPIQRQLLGHATGQLSFYLPGRSPEDVPLQQWLAGHESS